VYKIIFLFANSDVILTFSSLPEKLFNYFKLSSLSLNPCWCAITYLEYIRFYINCYKKDCVLYFDRWWRY